MRLTLCLSLSLLAALPVPGSATDVDELVRAERQLVADVAEFGLREGYLRHLIEESVVFRPLPVPAREWFENHEPPPVSLNWLPWHGEIAASGDFGYTIGPWTSRPLADPEADNGDEAGAAATEAAASHGYHLTVWIRGEQGDWHPLADHGIGGTRPAGDRDGMVVPATPRSAAIEGSFLLNSRYQGLMLSALRLTTGQARSSVERDWLAEDLMVLRQGRDPLVGHDAVREILSSTLGASEPMLVAMAASGDLGMSLGGDPGVGAHLRVWRHVDGSGWLLAAEVAVPAPSADGS